MEKKYMSITRDVLYYIGKGMTSALVETILESRSLNISMLTLDPDLNIDAGTICRAEHGEVSVTDDQAE